MLICGFLQGGERVQINPGTDEMPKYTVVPRGHVWLQGDNLPNSTDSRAYGPIPAGLIIARVIARVSACTMHIRARAHTSLGLAAVASCGVPALAEDGR